MKTKALVLCLILQCLMSGGETFSQQSFRNNGAKINLSVMVKDAHGAPVSGAHVLFLFKTGHGKMEFLRQTDKNGFASAVGHANLYIILRVSKDSFYQSDTALRFSNLNNEQAIKDEITQWESEPIVLTLKEKRKPCVEQRHVVSILNFPTNKWMSLDLDRENLGLKAEGQEGLGLEVRAWNTSDSSRQNRIRTMLELRTTGEDSGFLVYGDETPSRFRFPYEAPISGYKKSLIVGNPAQISDGHDMLTLGDDKDEKQIVFKLPDNGQERVVSYRYGLFIKLVPGFDTKRSTAWIQAIYYINSAADDRNTEYQYP